ncbi:MAG TPA: LacI family transcriptional regulator [Caldilineales bacterium]|nr:LacI family transcriptional regulator [Caldilineales bacterium]
MANPLPVDSPNVIDYNNDKIQFVAFGRTEDHLDYPFVDEDGAAGMRMLVDHLVGVGRDIAIAGFDDIPMAETAHPPLTTIHQPIYKIGRMLAEMLIKIIRNEPVPSRQIILQPQLMVRRSCGE